MSILESIILAVVEGLTEFLPVSSTGHMIIAQHLMGMESTDLVKAFTVIIQFGAILSVLILYWQRFFRDWDFYLKLFIAFLPAGICGLLFNKHIDRLLENVWVVAFMLVAGGIFMLFVDKLFNRPGKSQEITVKKALYIGLFQAVAMIPGVSRSMATIVGGMAQKLTRKTAAEFSFFLAMPTMFVASAWKVWKLFSEDGREGMRMFNENILILVIGNVVAFLVAIAAIRFFIGYVTKYGFKAFGYYRIFLGTLIIILLLSGQKLQII